MNSSHIRSMIDSKIEYAYPKINEPIVHLEIAAFLPGFYHLYAFLTNA